ncbi:hypothetical protein F0562_015736 [Nyssa sinensis]|uniref:Dehydrin n=1 Tax=Nyssa sinensis TaxID=561372 RepID=A0A5J4ZMS8_9ASTE|nr:hypothetical protein F0562_015736 [Nyssa sinensis]
MAGIMNKIGETLNIGGDKKKDERKPGYPGDQNKPECHVEHKQEQHGERKEGGFMDNIKGKIHGGEQQEQRGECKPAERKEGGFMDNIKGKIHGAVTAIRSFHFSNPYRWTKEEGY